jgi:hypothetical protein
MAGSFRRGDHRDRQTHGFYLQWPVFGIVNDANGGPVVPVHNGSGLALGHQAPEVWIGACSRLPLSHARTT